MKRAREPDAAPLPPHLAALSTIALRREVITRWSSSPFFDKLVRGRLIRCTAAGAPAPSLLIVLHVGETGAPVTLEFAAARGDVAVGAPVTGVARPPVERPGGGGGAGGGAALTVFSTVTTTSILTCFDFHLGRTVNVPIGTVSNSPATPTELTALLAAASRAAAEGGARAPKLPSQEECARLAAEWSRITRGHIAGNSSVVVDSTGQARLWGVGDVEAGGRSENGGGRTAAASVAPALQEGVRLAIIVPFRDNARQNRSAQLARFVDALPTFLASADVSPRLSDFFVVISTQTSDGYKFNRGKLLNIGFDLLSTRAKRAAAGVTGPALELGFDAFCFHDVDLIPRAPLGPWYAARPEPRPIHIGSAWTRYPYPGYVGGILTTSAAAFSRANGFPNDFWGWGGEDDEFARRLMRTEAFPVCRPAPAVASLDLIEDLEATLTVPGGARAGTSLKEGGERAWRNMVKTEALARHADTWARNGVNSLAYNVCGVRALAACVAAVDVDLFAKDDPGAQRLIEGDPIAASKDEARVTAVASQPAAQHWSTGIPRELTTLSSIQDVGRALDAAVALLPPAARALSAALSERTITIAAQAPNAREKHAQTSSTTSPSIPPEAAPMTPHTVWLLLRSWIAQDVAVEDAAAASTQDGDGRGTVLGGGAVLPISDSAGFGGTGVPDFLTASLSKGAAFDGTGRGTGPAGTADRPIGLFRFALEHRVLAGGSAAASVGGDEAVGGGWLSPPALTANRDDAGAPEYTAWRCARALLDESISFALFQTSVVAQIDVDVGGGGGGGGGSAAAAMQQPTRAGFITPAGSLTRRLSSSVQLFVIDVDLIARSRADPVAPLQPLSVADDTRPLSPLDRDEGARLWLRRASCARISAQHASLSDVDARSTVKLPVDVLSSWENGGGELCVSKWPSGLLWVDEAQLEALSDVPAAPTRSPPSPSFSRAVTPLPDLGSLRLRPRVAAALRAASGDGHPLHDASRVSTHSATPGGAELTAALLSASKGSGVGGSATWPFFRIGEWVPHLFPRRRGWHIARLWHGTSLTGAASILSTGFRRATCRRLPACERGACDDQMLGFGVYLGEVDKARVFATRHAVWGGEGERVGARGALVAVDVDLGYIKRAAGPCPCGARTCPARIGVDHWGSWYEREGFDSLYVAGAAQGGSGEATNVHEWAVADPARTVAIATEELIVHSDAPSGHAPAR